MDYAVFILAFASLDLIACKNIARNESAGVLQYAKVARWGSNGSEEIRTSRNTQYQNHRLKLKNSKRTPGVVYQYPVYPASASKVEKKIEHVPGIGEVVIQDRFEARPLFVYKNKQQALSDTYGAPASGSNQQPATAPTPITTPRPVSSFDTFPVYKPPSPPPISSSQSSESSYNSPFSSYNPPNFIQEDDSNFPDSYPPIEDKAPSSEAPKSKKPESSMTLGPPLAMNNEYDHPPAPDYQDHQPQDPMAIYKYHDDGPPQYPPQSEDDIFYPPDMPHDVKMPANAPPKPAMSAMDAPKGNNGPPADDTMDLAPPPNQGDHQDYSFPQYLYDQHHFDHHVYEEVPHTTMAPVKEDKRVSSTHYSYYYLGRKLWYIPLYFSIYFIIYVTVLIVKSIARHKVRLKYTWAEGGSASRESRTMTLAEERDASIPVAYQNVSVGIRNATQKYLKDVILMK